MRILGIITVFSLLSFDVFAHVRGFRKLDEQEVTSDYYDDYYDTTEEPTDYYDDYTDTTEEPEHDTTTEEPSHETTTEEPTHETTTEEPTRETTTEEPTEPTTEEPTPEDEAEPSECYELGLELGESEAVKFCGEEVKESKSRDNYYDSCLGKYKQSYRSGCKDVVLDMVERWHSENRCDAFEEYNNSPGEMLVLKNNLCHV